MAGWGAIHRIWLPGTEAPNSGLSQYFGHHGREEWAVCAAAAAAVDRPAFRPFAEAAHGLLAVNPDADTTIRTAGNDGNDLWYRYQAGVVRELRAACERSEWPMSAVNFKRESGCAGRQVVLQRMRSFARSSSTPESCPSSSKEAVELATMEKPRASLITG